VRRGASHRRPRPSGSAGGMSSSRWRWREAHTSGWVAPPPPPLLLLLLLPPRGEVGGTVAARRGLVKSPVEERLRRGRYNVASQSRHTNTCVLNDAAIHRCVALLSTGF
jgi:hypothetical protein